MVRNYLQISSTSNTHGIINVTTRIYIHKIIFKKVVKHVKVRLIDTLRNDFVLPKAWIIGFKNEKIIRKQSLLRRN